MGIEQPEPTVALFYGTSLGENTTNKVKTSNGKTEFFTDLLKLPKLSKIDHFYLYKCVKTYNKLQCVTTHKIADKIFQYIVEQKEELEEENQQNQNTL